MNIADYIAGSASSAQRVTAEAAIPPLREGYSRTQALLDHIADAGPISTADLCEALDITSRQVWGMLKDKVKAGAVTHERGMWARTAQEVADWQAAIDEAVMAKQEAEAVALLTRRGWTCIAPGIKAMTCADQPWTEDDALADAYFATGTEPDLFRDYWDLISRVGRWRERHAPTADRLEALADKMDRVCSDRFGPDWNIPF